MRRIALFFCAVFAVKQASGQLVINMKGCVINARATAADRLTKTYRCGTVAVALTGSKSMKPSSSGGPAYAEFGEYWFGERGDFGEPSKATVSYGQCTKDFGERSNFEGYQSAEVKYKCGSVVVILQGKWGEEIQGNWSYRTILGEVTSEPMWLDDPGGWISRATYQRWCPNQFGHYLCGWVDEPKVDHGKAPAIMRSKATPK